MPEPSCTKIVVHRHGREVALSLNLHNTFSRGIDNLGQVGYGFGDGEATTHGDPSHERYTYPPGAGNYTVTAGFTESVAPHVESNVYDGEHFYCPPTQVVIP